MRLKGAIIIKKISSTDVFVFVAERDQKRVEMYFGNSEIKYEIRRMPFEGMGGVIVCSRDGKEIWDRN